MYDAFGKINTILSNMWFFFKILLDFTRDNCPINLQWLEQIKILKMLFFVYLS